MNGETFSNNLINSCIFHLLNFERYTNFQQAARQAAIESNFQMVLFSEDFNTLFSVETRHNITIEAAVLSSFMQKLDREKKGVRVDVDDTSTYWGPVNIASRKYYLMLVDNDKKYTQEEIVKLAEIIELAMGMWNYVPSRDPSGEFIHALKRGNRELSQTIRKELRLNETDITAVFMISGIRSEDVKEVMAKFQSDQNMECIVSQEHDEIAGVVLASEDLKSYDVAAWEAFADEAYHAGAQKVFHSKNHEGIEGACNAFRLINETEAFVSLVYPTRKFFGQFEMAFIANCLNICMTAGSVKKNYLDLLRKVSGTDSKTRQLRETLETYILDSGLSIATTAKLLDVHSNTVQYRIKHLRELLGVDIGSNTTIPSLMTALAITRIDKEAGPF